MKKRSVNIITLGLLCLFSPHVYSQINWGGLSLRTPGESTVPASPETGIGYRDAVENFGQSSGAGSLNIPLFVSESFPETVFLEYRLGGFRVEEKAGDLGLGWSLVCGGSVSRQISGLPDELRGVAEERTGLLPNPPSHSFLSDIYRRKKDCMIDRYSYSFNGNSGSFIISEDEIIQIPQTDNKIIKEGTGTPSGFTIITPLGDRYIFRLVEKTNYQYTPVSIDATYDNVSYEAASSWHLTEVHKHDSGDIITYEYSRGGRWSTSEKSEFSSVGHAWSSTSVVNMTSSPGGLSDIHINSVSDVATLKKISCSKGSIEFTHTKATGTSDKPLYISGLSLKNKKGDEIEKAVFTYSNLSDGRRTLTEIKTTSGQTVTGLHKFVYSNIGGKVSKDFFGFRNAYIDTGEDGRGVFTPSGKENTALSYSFANALHGSMMSRESDTGLTVEYTYEPSETPVTSTRNASIGIRIKKVKATDRFTGKWQQRDFTYSLPMSTVDLSELQIYDFVSLGGSISPVYDDNGLPTGGNMLTLSATLSSDSRLPGVSVKNATVLYGTVTETLTGSGLDTPLRTEIEYDTSRSRHEFVHGSFYGTPAGSRDRQLAYKPSGYSSTTTASER